MKRKAFVELLDKRVLLSFTPVQTPVVYNEVPFFIEQADFNLDGKPDFATVLTSSNTVAILLGDGAGGFTQSSATAVAINSQAFAINLWVADLNLDAKVDLITPEPNGLAIHFGNGDGSFQTAQTVTAGGATIDVCARDVNVDGLPDLLVKVADDNNLRVLLANSMGGFTSQSTVGLGNNTRVLEVADLNRDGKPDVFTVGQEPNSVRVYLGNVLFVDQIYSVNITNINENPTNLILNSSNTAENQDSGAQVGTFSTTDPETGNTFTNTLVSGTGSTDNALFSINGNQLRAASSFDFESKTFYTVRVQTTDQGGLSFQNPFTITLTDANDAPTDIGFRPAVSFIGQPPNPADLQLSTADINPGDTFTYTLVSGIGSADNALFTVSGDHLFRIPGFLFDPQTQYSIRVRSTDQGGLFFEKVISFSGNLINDAPTDLSLSSTIISENQPIGTAVGTFSTLDRNALDNHTYTLVSGSGDADNAFFTIVDNSLNTAAILDFESRSIFSIRVRTIDNSGQLLEKALTLNITNANDTPTGLSYSRSSAVQAQTAGATLGTFSTTDPDTGELFSYSLASGTGADDNALFAISGNSLQFASGFVPSKREYSIRVRSTDDEGLFIEQTFSLPFTTVLTFHTLPVNGFNSLTLSPVIVRVTDVSGNLISGDTSSITLAIRTGPIGPELSGTLTKSAVGGEAIFSDLSLSLPGSYTFTATSSGLTEGNSASFDISELDASLLDERGNAQEDAPDIVLSSVRFRPVKGQLFGGSALSGTLSVRNSGAGTLTGTSNIRFVFSNDAVPSTLDTSTGTISTGLLRLAPGKSRNVTFSVTLPTGLTGNLQLLALVNPAGELAEKTSVNNVLKLRDVSIVAPIVNLTAGSARARATVAPGKVLAVTLPVSNTGNQAVNSGFQIMATFHDDMTGQFTTLGTFTSRSKIQPGRSASVRFNVLFSSELAGRSGQLLLTINPADTLGESNGNDNASNIFITVLPA